MWALFNCYLSGRHDFGVWCEPGAIFLRCVHCGKRSSGWSLEPKRQTPPPHATVAAAQSADRTPAPSFSRAAAR